MTRIHGGTDALGTARFDFSSNSNACGPCATVSTLIQQADASVYPDANYTWLREKLAVFHGIPTWRIVLASSASEFIFRMTALAAKQTALQGKVSLPKHSYADYAHAAQAWGLGTASNLSEAQLVWACEPSSPLGVAHAPWPDELKASQPALCQKVVVDCAYEPLRLSGQSSLSVEQWDTVWQLWTPNKALGFTGVRAAYAIAPLSAQKDALALEQLAASWPVGAHGVALLTAWTQPDVQGWLAESLVKLKNWKARQIDVLQNVGWTCLQSDSNFFCAGLATSQSPTQMNLTTILLRLRKQGIKLRDATSFGMPHLARISVQTPVAQDALMTALKELS